MSTLKMLNALSFSSCLKKWGGILFFIILHSSLLSQGSLFERIDSSSYLDNPTITFYGDRINDSIYLQDQSGYGFSEKWILVKKLNINASNYQLLYLKGHIDTTAYIDTSRLMYTSSSGLIYLVNHISTKPSLKKLTMINRMDADMNKVWSLTLKGQAISLDGPYGGNSALVQDIYFIDSSFYTVIHDADSSTYYIYKIESDGSIDKVLDVTSDSNSVHQYFNTVDTFIYIETDTGISTYSKDFTPLHKYHYHRNSAIPFNAFNSFTFPSQPNIYNCPGYLSTIQNNFEKYIRFMEPNMSRIYSMPFFNEKTYISINMKVDTDGKIHIYRIPIPDNAPYVIRHTVLDSDWKTIIKNTEYELPQFRDSFHQSVYFSPVYALFGPYYYSGGFFNDSTYLISIPYTTDHLRVNGTHINTDIIHIVNHDFSIFPRSREVCGEELGVIDTFYPILTPSVAFDTVQVVLPDTIAISFSIDSVQDIPPVATLYTHMGDLITRFQLDTHTLCVTDSIDLRSDTLLKYGESRWIVNYMEHNIQESFIKKDTLGYKLKHTGYIAITHIHTLNGCRDTFRDTIHYSDKIATSSYSDSLVCTPLLLEIGVYNSNYHTYLWSDGSSDTMLHVTDTGLYWVQKTGSCGTTIDTINVSYKTAINTNVIFSMDSLIICGNELPYTLHSGIRGNTYTYTWTPNVSTRDSTLLNTFGTYYLSITDGCHDYSDTFTMKAKSIVTPPSIADSVVVCASTYKIYKHPELKLEEKVNTLWVERDSIVLNKNEKKYFRWTDSCGSVTNDSIYDYERGNFPSLPTQVRVCEVTDTFIENKNSYFTQYERVSSTWTQNDKIKVKIGNNDIRLVDSCGNEREYIVVGYEDKVSQPVLSQDSIVKCSSEFPLTISALSGFDSYQWNTGAITQNIQVQDAGSYNLTASDGCYYHYDTIEVAKITPVYENAIQDSLRELCKKILNTKVSTDLVYSEYIWNTLKTTVPEYIADTSENTILLNIPRRCDTLSDRLNINWLSPIVPHPKYTIDSNNCSQSDGAVQISLSNPQDYTRFLWNESDSSEVIYSNSYSSLTFRGFNICTDRFFELVPYYCSPRPIGLPNSFTPNGDGLHDLWELQGAKNILIHKMMVFNRWGEKIYESNRTDFKWDGKYRGELVPSGVYTYYLDYEYLPQKIRKTMSGEVNVFY